MQVRELIDRYIEEMKTVDPLGESHLASLQRLKRDPIAQKEATELKKSDIVDQVKLRRETVCAATAMHDLTFLRGVLQYAPSAWDDCIKVSAACIAAALPLLVKHGLVGKSTPRKRRPRDEEIEALVNYFKLRDARGRTKIKMVPVLMFALASTRRRGEICRLQWGDVDFENRTYMIRDMKHPTKKIGNHKTFALFPELAEIIRAQPRLTNDPTERVFPYNPVSLGMAYTLAKKALGIVDLRFHDNRREAISRFLSLGLPPHKVRLISGHENTVILEKVYDKRDPTEVFGDLERLAA